MCGKSKDTKISPKGSEEDRRRTNEEIDRHRGSDDWFHDATDLIDSVKKQVDNESIDKLILDDNFNEQLDTLAIMESILGEGLDLPPVEQLPDLLQSGKKGLDEVKKEAQQADEGDKGAVFENYQKALFGLALVGGAAGIAYLVMQRIANKQATDDLMLEADTKKVCMELISKWQKMSDDEFWNNFATVVDTGLILDGAKREWSSADQIVFLKLTADLCPATEPFQWDKFSDANDNAKTIKGFFDQTKKKSDLYRNVLKATYKGKALQRMWAANQLTLVLGSMIPST